MLFLVDAQLPPVLAKDLCAAGFDALHVADLDLLTATDAQIWDETVAQSAILITKDRDFALIRAARRTGPQIVWIRFGNIDNRSLSRKILGAMPKVIMAIQRGDTVVEIVG